MPLKIVRNDITKMKTNAIVNTANSNPVVGTGCDTAIYEAAGYDKLLSVRQKIGFVPEGEAFITSGYKLAAKYIIHAVSPAFIDGEHGEENKLRGCYRNCLRIAKENKIKSIAFPLISTGGFGYPKEEGMRIAVDEVTSFLLSNEMTIYIVVFDDKMTAIGNNLFPDLENYIDRNYVKAREQREYGFFRINAVKSKSTQTARRLESSNMRSLNTERLSSPLESSICDTAILKDEADEAYKDEAVEIYKDEADEAYKDEAVEIYKDEDIERLENILNDRVSHMTDTFAEYLMYLIKSKGMDNAEVYKRAIVDKKVFSKIKNNMDYHPQKNTALRLCIGAKLNMDETRDLLARSGYALSPCDKTDIIFSYFIEHKIYDMIELDIQLERFGEPCVIC